MDINNGKSLNRAGTIYKYSVGELLTAFLNELNLPQMVAVSIAVSKEKNWKFLPLSHDLQCRGCGYMCQQPGS